MRARGRRTLLIAVAVLVALTVAGAAAVWSSRGRIEPAPATDLERLGLYGQVPGFALIERSGKRITRDDFRGLVWVANFIYTECRESCPTQSLQVALIQREFSSSPDLRLVSITVDPQHDTPEVLRRYAERYGAGGHWLFLTGDRRQIYCLARDGFRLGVADPAATEPVDCGVAGRLGPATAWASHGSGAVIMHSARIVLVDRAARVRAYHLATDPESLKRLRSNLRRLLEERTSP